MIALLRPIITEKTIKLTSQGQFTFEVNPRATAPQVADEIEKKYNVHVVAVRTANISGKERRYRWTYGRTKNYKKAIISLKTGEKIPGFSIEAEEKTAEKSESKTKTQAKANAKNDEQK